MIAELENQTIAYVRTNRLSDLLFYIIRYMLNNRKDFLEHVQISGRMYTFQFQTQPNGSTELLTFEER